jgi:hypothetical protein
MIIFVVHIVEHMYIEKTFNALKGLGTRAGAWVVPPGSF